MQEFLFMLLLCSSNNGIWAGSFEHVKTGSLYIGAGYMSRASPDNQADLFD